MKKFLSLLFATVVLLCVLLVSVNAESLENLHKDPKEVEVNSVVTEYVYKERNSEYPHLLKKSSNLKSFYYIIDLPTKGKLNITVDGATLSGYWVSLYDSNCNVLVENDIVSFAYGGRDTTLDRIGAKQLSPGKYGLFFGSVSASGFTPSDIYAEVTISFGFEEDHEAGEWVTIDAGNCEEKGVRAKYCKYCDKEMEREETGYGDHDYGKWEVVREATEETDGLRIRECDICGKEDEDVLDQLVHGEYTTAETIEATCTEDGAKNKVCQYCNEIVESEVIPAKGHEVSKWKIFKEPTAIYAGIEEGECSTCKQMVEREVPNDPTLPIDPDEPIPFDDITKDKWYYDTVLLVYINHYMIGPSPAKFNPDGNITVAEAITVAMRIFSANADKNTEKLDDYLEKKPLVEGKAWYQPYVDYAILVGIIKEGDFESYSASATRAEMAYIFARCVEMEQINEVETIPDVDREDKYGEEIYYLYNAGILAGNDEHGTFTPEREITRAEVSALIARITKLTDRVKKV